MLLLRVHCSYTALVGFDESALKVCLLFQCPVIAVQNCSLCEEKITFSL